MARVKKKICIVIIEFGIDKRFELVRYGLGRWKYAK